MLFEVKVNFKSFFITKSTIFSRSVIRRVVIAVRRHLQHPVAAAAITLRWTITEIQDRHGTEAGHQFQNVTGTFKQGLRGATN